MEEWLQTEWPHLRVHVTSVTEQWATFPVVGPRSRDVVAAVPRAWTSSKEAFPFMTWRDTHGRRRAGARVARISFSGELAYEVNVDALARAGAVGARWSPRAEPYGITPYGTETMHVLRAEKGYPIIGQDTDGTVTPQDLGMAWVVSKKKPDFLGKRSFARADNQPPGPQAPGRPAAGGPRPCCCPRARSSSSARRRCPQPPVPMLGHVTSSYRSAALGRTLRPGPGEGRPDRIGETVHVPVAGRARPRDGHRARARRPRRSPS